MFSIICILGIALAGSPGCGKKSPIDSGTAVVMNMTIHDPITNWDLDRDYNVSLPKDYDENKEYPIMMIFHGWAGNPQGKYIYEELAQVKDIIYIAPEGMADEDGEEPRHSWNVGDAGNLATCTNDTVPPMTSCYLSCQQIKKCSRCNCFTCVDDVYFVRKLFEKVENDFCVDTNKRYVAGESNGGMFTYYLAGQMSDVVTGGYGLICGQPMVGWINTPRKAAEKMMISFHGRDDPILPPEGGVDKARQWIYESLDETFWVWGV